MTKKGPAKNPYRLVRQTPLPEKDPRKVEPVIPPPPFEKGDTLRCFYKPLLFRISEPCVVLDLKWDDRKPKMWMVQVPSSDGPVWLAETHLKKL